MLDTENWIALCTLLGTKERYVKLDLSTCTAGSTSNSGDFGLRADGTFDARVSTGIALWDNTTLEHTGLQHITELILPDAATAIVAGPGFNGTGPDGMGLWLPNLSSFAGYINLKKLTGRNVAIVGDNGFYNPLSVTLPMDIGKVTDIFLPKAVTFGQYTFYQLASLRNLTLSKDIQTIGSFSFYMSDNVIITLEGSGNAQVFANGKVLVTATGQLAALPVADSYDLDLSSTSLTGAALGTVFRNINRTWNAGTGRNDYSAANTGIRSIILPATVTSISANAFQGCIKL
jgi:hypothetical protein